MFKKCKHEWEVLVNEYEKSQIEKMNEKNIIMSKFSASTSFCCGKKIIIIQCKKCGKLDKTIEEI